VNIRLSNGKRMLPGGLGRGRCRIEVGDGAGFVIDQREGGSLFRQVSPARGDLRLDPREGSIDVQEHEFGTDNA
jgi:hypothetical protein